MQLHKAIECIEGWSDVGLGERNLVELAEYQESAESLAQYIRTHVKERFEYLRGEIDNERISYAELHELQSLAAFIDDGDKQLLEWAGVPEFPEENSNGYTEDS